MRTHKTNHPHLALKLKLRLSKHYIASSLIALCLAGSLSPAYANFVLQNVEAKATDNGDLIKLNIDKAAVASAAMIANQLVIELNNTAGVQANAVYSYTSPLVKKIKSITLDNKTRVIIDLNKPTKFVLTKQNQGIEIQLTQDASNMQFTPAALTLPKAQNYQVEKIDFSRTESGIAKVLIDLNNREIISDIRQNGNQITVDFLSTVVPAQLYKQYNVNDFGTVVKSMSLSNTSKGARLNIQLKQAAKYNTYQADQRFVVEINPQAIVSAPVQGKQVAQQAGNFATKKYTGQKLSLNFQDIDIRSLMQVFADFTNLNVVVNDNVQGNLTLRLKDIPWDQAFDIVMESKNLGYKRNGGVIWVAPKEELAAKEKAELEVKAQLSDLEPVKTQTFQLNYHKADIVAKGITGEDAGKSMLSKKGSITHDARTNQIFATDISSKLEEIADLIKKIDVPVKQVMIEARIVEADDKFGRNLGMKLGFIDKTNTTGTPVLGSNNRLVVSGNQQGALQNMGLLPTESGTGLIDLVNTNFLSLPAAGLGGFTPASLGISLFSVGASTLLNLELSALESDGKGKIVSSPKILTTDKQKAIIEQGTELPYQAASASGATTVQFKKANLKLEVTPQITPSGQVFLDVDINKDSPSGISNGSAGLAIDTKHVQTQVLVDNGGTVMIGGIFQEMEQNSVTKVPVLGDIPYVGNLFKNKTKSRQRTELLIFLTPKISDDIKVEK